jgi:hypothetical protein
VYLACRASHQSLNHTRNDKFTIIIAARGLDQWAEEELNRLLLVTETRGEAEEAEEVEEEAGEGSGYDDDDDADEGNDDVNNENLNQAPEGVATGPIRSGTSRPEKSNEVKREVTSESGTDFEFPTLPEASSAAAQGTSTGGITAGVTAGAQRGRVSNKGQAVSHPAPAEEGQTALLQTVLREVQDLKRRLPMASVEGSPKHKRTKTIVLPKTGTQTVNYRTSSTQTAPEAPHKTPVVPPGLPTVPSALLFQPEVKIESTAATPTGTTTGTVGNTTGGTAGQGALNAQVESAVGAAFARHSDQFQASMQDICTNTVRAVAEEMLSQQQLQQQQRHGGIRGGLTAFSGGGAGTLTAAPRLRPRAMPPAQKPEGRGFAGMGGAGIMPEWDAEYDEMIDMRNFGGRGYGWRGM